MSLDLMFIINVILSVLKSVNNQCKQLFFLNNVKSTIVWITVHK